MRSLLLGLGLVGMAAASKQQEYHNKLQVIVRVFRVLHKHQLGLHGRRPLRAVDPSRRVHLPQPRGQRKVLLLTGIYPKHCPEFGIVLSNSQVGGNSYLYYLADIGVWMVGEQLYVNGGGIVNWADEQCPEGEL